MNVSKFAFCRSMELGLMQMKVVSLKQEVAFTGLFCQLDVSPLFLFVKISHD